MDRTPSFNAKNRVETIQSVTSDIYDLIIIGGGITGGGILLDASSRGIKTLLVEKSDFGAGTSGRSTKLIHGGLRYLKNFEFRLVRETGRERTILFKNAPHLVIPEKLMIPLTKKGNFKKWQLSWALKIYDHLAGVKEVDKRQILNRKSTLNKEPLLDSINLLGAGLYAEYRTDDARLTLEVIKTALKYNGIALNYSEVIDTKKTNGVFHLICTDNLTNKKFELKAKSVINATGPWVDELCKMDLKESSNKICLSKGIHIVINKNKLPLNHPIYFEVEDGRMCFAIPRDKVTYIGTTDTAYSGNKNEPTINIKDINYLINAVNNTFNINAINKSDIISSWSGLRPLIKKEGISTKELSRKDEISISKTGMITIAGGKLTGYRIMAKKIVDLICKKQKIHKKCVTDTIKINGGDLNNKSIKGFNTLVSDILKKLKIDNYNSKYLISNYGIQTELILDLFKSNNFKHLVEAEVVFCLNNENLHNPLDFFLRRTGKIYFYTENVLQELELVMPHFINFLSLNENEANQMKQNVEEYLKNLTNFSE